MTAMCINKLSAYSRPLLAVADTDYCKLVSNDRVAALHQPTKYVSKKHWQPLVGARWWNW